MDSSLMPPAPIKRSSSATGAASSSQGPAAAAAAASGRSKPRASLACLNCRQRKIKCNGLGPGKSCASCTALRVPCQISRDGDRRKTGSREQVAALQERLQMLESMVTAQQTSPPVPALPSQSPVDPTLHRPSTDHGPNVTSRPPALRRDQSESSHQDPFPSDLSMPHSSPSANLDPPTSAAAFQRSPHPSDLSRNTSSSDRVLQESRLDVDESRGQTRYYGPTSQLYIQKQRGTGSSDDSSSLDTRQSAADLKMDSTPLRNSLLQTYFENAPLSVIMADEQLFWAGRSRVARSEYYSVFLENCICACATRLSTSADVRSLGPKYIERAKADIADELDTANTASLQGFLLLSDFEATRGRDRVGYLYSGLGCRLVFDLGLAEDCSALIAQGKVTEKEAMWRHTLLLNTYVFDKLWAMYLGRPSTIPVSIAATAHHRAIDQGWDGPQNLEPFVGLCTEMSEVTEILNSASPLGRATIERLTELDNRIFDRCENLPKPLALDQTQIAELHPTAYCLHVQFHGIRVVLHRLLSRAIASHNSDGDQPNERDNEAQERSKRIIYENAVAIARLVSTYQQLFGIEKVITIMLDNSFVASAVLLGNILQMQTDEPNCQPSSTPDWHWLHVLTDMLAKAHKHYPVTARMRSTLAGMVKGTPLEGMFSTQNAQQQHRSQQVHSEDHKMAQAIQSQSLEPQPDPMSTQQHQHPQPQYPPPLQNEIHHSEQYRQLEHHPHHYEPPQHQHQQPPPQLQHFQPPPHLQEMAMSSARTTPAPSDMTPTSFHTPNHIGNPYQFGFGGDPMLTSDDPFSADPANRFAGLQMAGMMSWIMPSPNPTRPGEGQYQFG